VALAAFLCWSSVASAKPVDVRSAHAALRDYKAYLSSVVSQLSAARRADDVFVGTIAAKCPNAAASLRNVTVTPTNQPILNEFGEEIGGDVVLPAAAPFQKPLATLTRRLSKLHWSSGARKRSIARSLAKQARLYALPPSDLCADASALAAGNAQSLPPGTAAFVAGYQNATRAAGLDALKSTLSRFARRGDRKLRSRVRKLQQEAGGGLESVARASGNRLLQALGLA
jgi:hypothetical protein